MITVALEGSLWPFKDNSLPLYSSFKLNWSVPSGTSYNHSWTHSWWQFWAEGQGHLFLLQVRHSPLSSCVLSCLFWYAGYRIGIGATWLHRETPGSLLFCQSTAETILFLRLRISFCLFNPTGFWQCLLQTYAVRALWRFVNGPGVLGSFLFYLPIPGKRRGQGLMRVRWQRACRTW